MTFSQALRYFFVEALVNLRRSWKSSSIAVLTIGTSLTVGGFFLLLTDNLARVADRWRAELKVVLYLESEASEDAVASLMETASAPSWALDVQLVDAAEASERFREAFPSLAELVERPESESEPLPSSVEITIAENVPADELAAWVASLEPSEAVSVVDSDREWLDQLAAVLALARVVGITLGLGLLVAATFTIASVIRLTAMQYLEEIEVMRLVGATEFFIRGPFYAEGLLQGLFGSLLAVASLFAIHRGVLSQSVDSVWLGLLFSKALSWRLQGVLLGLGSLAGLIGAVASLRRETLRTSPDSG